MTFFDLEDLGKSFTGFTDSDGRFKVALASGGISQGFRLLQNFPNPFNPGTTIPYALTQTADVRLEMYNILGQRVRVLTDQVQAAGRYTAQWDARDEQGRGMAAGMYIYRLTVDGVSDTRQMILMDGRADAVGGGGGFPTGGVTTAPGPARVYGVSISGQGVDTYVQADVRVGAGTDPMMFAVMRADVTAMKQASGTKILGDVNNDGRVSVTDALIVATYVLDSSISIPNGGDILLGDVNGDGRVTITDALIIATYELNPANSSLPSGIGQAVGADFSLIAISPSRGAPGTPVDLSGTFDANAEYLVQFGNVSVPALSVQAGRISTVVPGSASGSVAVSVSTTDGRRSDTQTFSILALSAPRIPASQMQQKLKTMGSTFNGGITSLAQSGGIYSGANAQAVSAEIQKLDAAWTTIGNHIAALSPDEYKLLANLLDNAGVLELMESMTQSNFAASKQSSSSFF